ncbi:hypothetical protein M2271_001580 [Streptomyces sp. LBL]|uniref:hypothetical protein n=1 Tax=Streptomyces sp. LBL TaxID=2940562 RepID=UPI0024770CDB|nr:hypothetical protein [Streptomyces sp. LBL]MDH6623788.1 hypothetical protein [Streptomyces sp. LBL]
MSEVLLPRVQRGTQSSSRGAAQQTQRGFQRLVQALPHQAQIPADAQPLARRAQQPVARGQRWALRVVTGVVVGLARLDSDVPQRQITGTGAVAEDPYVFEVPLADRRAGLVEDLQGEGAERRRALGRARVRAAGNSSPSGAQPSNSYVSRAGGGGSAKRSVASSHSAHVSS